MVFSLAFIISGPLYAETTATVTIPSTQPWTDTGLTVSPGDVISVSASGTVIFADPHTPEHTTGPDGKTGPSGDCSFVVTNAAVPAQALIGNIANSATLDGNGFFVGSNFNSTVPIANTTTQSGKLFLGFNDSAVSCDRSGYDAWGFGGDNHGSFTATITITPAPGEELFVTNSITNSVTVYSRTASGNTATLRTLTGAATGLNVPRSLAVDLVNNELVVANAGNNSVTVYARMASGNAPPLRTLQGAATGLSGLIGLTVDTANNELLVANYNDNSITVYPRTANGNTAPLRTLAGAATGLSGPGTLAVDPVNNELIISLLSKITGNNLKGHCISSRFGRV